MNAMISHGNDWTIFFTRPIAGIVMALTAITLLLPFFSARRSAPRGEPDAIIRPDLSKPETP